MKKATLFVLSVALTICSLHAQQIRTNGMDSLHMIYTTPDIFYVEKAGTLTLSLRGFELSGALGTSALPVQSTLVEIPFCQSVEVHVRNAVYDTLPLPAPLSPRQPSRSKSHSTPYHYDAIVYATDAYLGAPLFEVQVLGVARDRRLANLYYSPLQVNPVQQKLIVCRSAEVTLHFIGADSARTAEQYRRYHTRSFSLGNPLNTLPVKSLGGEAPVRLSILASYIFHNSQSLQEFVQWKRSQGLLVDVHYVSGTNYSIKETVNQLFENPSPENPAPSYLLLVGDHEQLPAFFSNLPYDNIMHESDYQCDDHVTDHYYTTITDDNLPDCYIGRFSAADTATLRTIIEKTLLYETYAFTDDSYLGKAALVAGVDNFSIVDFNDAGFQIADPTMDYIAYQYVNAAHGFSDVAYCKNNYLHCPAGVTVTGDSRSSKGAQQLLQRYNSGMGLVNYTAHGAIDMWAKPTFTSGQASKLTNYGKPSVMIGNCCLSCHFDSPACLGETLLRCPKGAGAVVYFGCTNSSFWEEDMAWSIGMRTLFGLQMPMDYDSNYRGMYDHLFHTHGESYGQQAVTAGRMLHAGVMAVNDRPGNDSWYTSIAAYYWEVYCLLGDPTLMPWLGPAKTLPKPTVTMKPNEQMLTIEAPEGAYVAIIGRDSLQLMASAYAWTDGLAYLPMCDGYADSCFISITAQGYRPYRVDFADATLGIADIQSESVTIVPNPAHSMCTIYADGLESVQLLDPQGRLVLSSTNATLNVGSLPSGMYFVRVITRAETTVKRLIVR